MPTADSPSFGGYQDGLCQGGRGPGGLWGTVVLALGPPALAQVEIIHLQTNHY